MTDLALSRRAVARAMIALPAITAPGVATATVPAIGPSPAMVQALAAYHQAIAVQHAWENRTNQTASAWDDVEQGRVEDASYHAMRAVDTFPVVTVADLIAKVEFARDTGGKFEPEDLLPDLRRIAGEA